MFIEQYICSHIQYIYQRINPYQRAVTEGQGRKPTPGFIYTSAEVKDYPASLGVMCCQHVGSPSRCPFLDRVYRQKLIAIQFPHNTPIPFIGRKSLSHRDSKQRFFPFYEFEAERPNSHCPLAPISYRSVVERYGSLGKCFAYILKCIYCYSFDGPDGILLF